jgi:hypothetical protein
MSIRVKRWDSTVARPSALVSSHQLDEHAARILQPPDLSGLSYMKSYAESSLVGLYSSLWTSVSSKPGGSSPGPRKDSYLPPSSTSGQGHRNGGGRTCSRRLLACDQCHGALCYDGKDEPDLVEAETRASKRPRATTRLRAHVPCKHEDSSGTSKNGRHYRRRAT